MEIKPHKAARAEASNTNIQGSGGGDVGDRSPRYENGPEEFPWSSNNNKLLPHLNALV